MSTRYLITTDNTADLPPEFIERHALSLMCLGYSIAGKDYDDVSEKLDAQTFYRLMREGNMTKTAQVNPAQARAMFEPFVKQGYDLLHIAFSSGLSGTYQSACIAAGDLMRQYPERRVIVVDSLCASLGEGLLVYHALKRREDGESLDEVRAWLEGNKLRLCHNFTVDDLNFLCRGGRVSKTAAAVGTMLGIKPVLHMDDTGHLVPIAKVRGRKQSLARLVDNMAAQVGGYKNDAVFISHGDCREDADYVAGLVRERFGVQEVVIHFVGPTIGAHSGPGTVALFFLGKKR